MIDETLVAMCKQKLPAVARRHAVCVPTWGESAGVLQHGGRLSVLQKQIADLAIKNRLPSMCEGSESVQVGCLVSYAANQADQFRRTAVYVEKILKGRKPADLPVEQPMRFEFVVNLKTAKQIGLTIPPNVLARADKVIK